MSGNRVARIILGIIFVGLLVAPLVLKRLSARRTAERSTADAKTIMARHGFYLQEVSQAAGILMSRLDPVAAGALVSMSNPYWWVWWVTIGSAFLLRFDISLKTWPALVAFFIGHELGDLGWYTAVSTALSLGRRRIRRGVMSVMMGICGATIIGFGVYLGVSPFLAH
jgi:threonine/homoserine/homoserine lactone efflux protein